MIDKMP